MNGIVYFIVLFFLLLLTVVRVILHINDRDLGVQSVVLLTPVDTRNHVQIVKVNGEIVSVWNRDMLRSGECLVVDLDRRALEGKNEKCDDSLMLFFSRLRIFIINRANKILPAPYSSILLGVVFGIEQKMPDEVHELLSAGGLMHVIVASGYNINILLGVVVFLFKPLNKYLLICICSLSIFGYLFISGLNPPLVRASIMGTIFLIHEIDGSYIPPLVVLYIAIVFMLLFAPWLINDIGFIMSVCATLGLYFSGNYNIGTSFSMNLKDIIFVNLFLAPISVGIWGVVSVGGMIANILFLPYVPFIMVISLLSLTTNNILLKELFIFLIDYLLFVVDKLNSVFGSVYLESFESRMYVILIVLTIITLLVINEIRNVRHAV